MKLGSLYKILYFEWENYKTTHKVFNKRSLFLLVNFAIQMTTTDQLYIIRSFRIAPLVGGIFDVDAKFNRNLNDEQREKTTSSRLLGSSQHQRLQAHMKLHYLKKTYG